MPSNSPTITWRRNSRGTSIDCSGYNVFVDGGLWANNPVLVGLIDALDLTERGQEIHIFCLGTCPLPAGEQIPKGAVDRGLYEFARGRLLRILQGRHIDVKASLVVDAAPPGPCRSENGQPGPDGRRYDEQQMRLRMGRNS